MALTVAAAEAAVTKTRCERSLRFYLEHSVWPVIEPETPFKAGWHLDAMADHCQATVRGEIRNLLVTVPPRHSKSITISIAMPSWAWIEAPELRFLFASFSHDLSLEHAVLSRRVILSEKYQEFWSENYKLQYDQNVKSFYENNHRGYRISTLVGGTVTGRGGDLLVLDDPHNLQMIDSELERRSVLHFWSHTWSSRFNDPKTGRRIVVMQRGHESDLAAHIMETAPASWVHLNLPTRYEPTPWVELRGNVVTMKGSVASEEELNDFAIRVDTQYHDLTIRNHVQVNPLGWTDPRTVEGELLNPTRFGPDEVASAERDLGPRGFATQHQQRPQPQGGGIFQREKVKLVDPGELPQNLPYSECRGWDQAATEEEIGKEPDYTAGVKIRRYANGSYYIVHCVRDRWGPEEADRMLLTYARVDGFDCKQREEQEGGSAGKKVTAAHERLLEAYDYEGVPKHVNKTVYCKPFATRWDAGDVYIVRGMWNDDFIDELVAFPGKHDDQVDAAATSFHELAANPVAMLSASEVLAIGGREQDRRSAIKRKEF